MTCHATGRRPRRKRVLVPVIPGPDWSDLLEPVASVVDMPKPRPGCAIASLAICGIFGTFFGSVIWLGCVIVDAVWS